MHNIYLTLVLLIITNTCFGQCFRQEYNKPFEGLTGNPVKYIENTYGLSGNEKEWQSTNEVCFSSQGFILEAITSTPDYKFTTRNTNLKNGRPLRTEKISDFFTEKMNLSFEYLIHDMNDTLDMIIVNTSFSEDIGNEADTIYLKYDKGQIISERISGNQTFKDLEITLDRRNNVIDNKIWIDTILFRHTHHKYDKNGLLKDKTDLIVNGMNDDNTFSYEYSEFDRAGNWTECIETLTSSGDKKLIIREIQYQQ